jgi:MoaA/NifB/PqqE/SkfB family radical SAM enzyme
MSLPADLPAFSKPSAAEGAATQSAIAEPAPAAVPAAGAFAPAIVGRWRSFFALKGIVLRLVWLALRHIPHPLLALRTVQQLRQTRRLFSGDFDLIKVAYNGGRYYYDLNTPGWPSRAFDDYHLSELNRITPFRQGSHYLKILLLAITKKCAMQCAHCFEWDALNGKEKLSEEDLLSIVGHFQHNGVGQVQLSGGEPLLRMPAILKLLEKAQPNTEFWVLTSGHRLTAENAQALAQAGLTGISISLDHVHPQLHNQFRGFDTAYAWVEAAAAQARQAGLLVSLSLCATRAFVTEENLLAYMELAHRLGAGFVQILEPRAVGHFAGQDVALTTEQTQLLEDFYLRLNYDPAYRHLPIITYHEYHRRRVGCVGAADRYVYVDTDGQLHACPFCRQPVGSALAQEADGSLQALRQTGCPDPASPGCASC